MNQINKATWGMTTTERAIILVQRPCAGGCGADITYEVQAAGIGEPEVYVQSGTVYAGRHLCSNCRNTVDLMLEVQRKAGTRKVCDALLAIATEPQ